jgi:alcohol dehydrogenase (cytochrome c)
MNQMQQNPAAHLMDIDVILDGPYQEKPGESTLEQYNTDIPEREITQDDLMETGERKDNWLLYGGGYHNQRRYPGTELNHNNVAELELEWSLEYPNAPVTREPPGADTHNSPVIVDGDPPIMYLTFGPDELFAVNARTGEIMWSHIYEPMIGASQATAPAERGVGLIGDMVVKSTMDYGVLALNRYTGEEEWYYNGGAAYRDEQAEGLIHEEIQWTTSRGVSSAFPPMIKDGMIMKGSFGGEYGTAGWFEAISLDGEPQWRVQMTPDEAWVGDSWKHGGGTAWASAHVDVESNNVIVPASNAGPWYGTVRPGFNPYTCGKVALDVETGEYSWHYQDSPHDYWDYDSPSPSVAYTAEVGGEERRLVSWAGKVPWVFTVDAETGKLVQRTDNTTQQHNMWILPPKEPGEDAPWNNPYAGGGSSSGQVPSYHRESRTMVHSATNVPWRIGWTPATYEAGEQYLGYIFAEIGADPTEHDWYNGMEGVVTAVDPVSGEVKWQDHRENNFRGGGGAATTASGITFLGAGGSDSGEFIAYDTETGEKLWTDDVGGGPGGGPVIWEDPDEQKVYVCVSMQNAGVTNVYSVEYDA